MSNQQNKNISAPIIIIVLVLAAVVVGGFWFYNSSKSRSSSGPKQGDKAQAANAARVPENAPAGAPLGVNMLGSSTAAVTVEEFADFQCGGCAGVHHVMKELQAAYAGNKNFRFIFRHFPLQIPAHDKAYEGAAAVEAAGLQGKFWQMQDLLFRNQQAWTANPNYRELWSEYAGSIGLDVERFKADLAGIQTKERVDADIRRGRGLNVTSTPSLFVNGRLIPFQELNITSLRRIIDEEIQRTVAARDVSSGAANDEKPSGNTLNPETEKKKK